MGGEERTHKLDLAQGRRQGKPEGTGAGGSGGSRLQMGGLMGREGTAGLSAGGGEGNCRDSRVEMAAAEAVPRSPY